MESFINHIHYKQYPHSQITFAIWDECPHMAMSATCFWGLASMRCESRKQWVEFPVNFIFIRLLQILVHEDDKESVKYSVGTWGPKHFIRTARRYPWVSAFSVSSKRELGCNLGLSMSSWLLKWTWLWAEQLRQPWKEGVTCRGNWFSTFPQQCVTFLLSRWRLGPFHLCFYFHKREQDT